MDSAYEDFMAALLANQGMLTPKATRRRALDGGDAPNWERRYRALAVAVEKIGTAHGRVSDMMLGTGVALAITDAIADE